MRSRAELAEGYTTRLPGHIRSIEKGLAEVRDAQRSREVSRLRVARDELGQTVRVASFMRNKAAELVGEATPALQSTLRELLGTLDELVRTAKSYIGQGGQVDGATVDATHSSAGSPGPPSLAREHQGESRADAVTAARDTTRLERGDVRANNTALAPLSTEITVPRHAPQVAATAIGREAEILAILTAPVSGPIEAAYKQMETALGGEFSLLDRRESSTLAERLERRDPNDAIAKAFGRMNPERRGRLLGQLIDPKRLAHKDERDLAKASSPGAVAQPVSTALARGGSEGPAPASFASSSAPTAHSGSATGQKTKLTKVEAAPAGTVICSTRVDLSLLGAEHHSQSGSAAGASATLLVSGDRILLHIQTDDAHWVASATAAQLVDAIAGPRAMKELGSATAFLRKLPDRVRQGGTKLRVSLWGTEPNESFAVLDVQRIVQGAEAGTLAGFRPVEAQILLGRAGGVRVFGGDQVRAEAAIPGSPIGGEWFELAPDPRLWAALGTEHGPSYGGAFYDHGVLRIAVKPTRDAETGLVAHIDLLYLAKKLEALGRKAASWVAKLVDRIKNNVIDFLNMIGNTLRFELPDVPGTWFELDLSMQLPRLFKGGHFDLAGLLPTGFHIDLGGLSLGALPSIDFPWLRGPSLGSFHVNWSGIRKILGSLSLPRLPGLDLSLHHKGDFTLGLGVDLGALIPDLGDFALGFELDLEKLLSRIERGGHWLLARMRKAGDWLTTHVHLGRDGVLRIYDRADPAGPMLGFHLARLLDGADPTDLAPTEIRYGESKGAASIEMGEVQPVVEGAADAQPTSITGKVSPERPEGVVVMRRQAMAAPVSLAKTLALAPGTAIDVELIKHGNHLTVWSQAKSSVYAHEQALRTTVSMDAIGAAIARLDKLRPLHLGAGDLPIALDLQHSIQGPRITFGRLAIPSSVSVAGKAGKVSGYAEWKLEQLLSASDWTHVVPVIAQVSIDGVGGVQLGKLTPSGALLGSHTFDAPQVRRTLLHADDGVSFVYGAIYKGKDLIEVAVAKDPTITEGALASLHPSALLSLLRKLGELGRRALERIADIAMPTWRAGGTSDVWHHLTSIAQAVADQFLKFVNGILSIRVGGIDLSWDLNLQIPRFRDHINLDALIPDIRFSLPNLPGCNFSFAHGPGFGNPFTRIRFPKLRELLPDLHVPDIELGVAWIEGGFDLGMSIDLGNLLGDGNRSIQFRLPLQVIFEKLQRLGDRIGRLLGKVGDTLDRLKSFCHLGADGVLRLYDQADPGTRVGFDLKKLLDGAQADDLVPVELHADIDVKGKAVAEIAYGDDKIDAKDKKEAEAFEKNPTSNELQNAGKVLVAPPRGQAAVRTTMKAPSWVVDHLGIAPAARIHASLYLDDTDHRHDAVLFASVDGSDRGIEIRVHVDQLTSLAGTLGPIKSDVGIALDVKQTMTKRMLVVTFGKDKSAELHGHVAWKIENLIADPSLASLVPDEIVAERKEGALELSSSINVSGLKQYGAMPLAGLDWAKRVLQSDHALVFAAKNLREHPRVALTSDRRPDGTYSGVELKLDPKFVETMEAKAHQLADRTRAAATKAFRRDRSDAMGRWDIKADPRGVTVSRGLEGQPDHAYASYGWHHLARMATGDVDLVPDDLRVGTQSMAIEMHALSMAGAPATDAHEIKSLHPLLRDPLLAVGLEDDQRIEFNKKESKIVGGTPSQVRAAANVWKPDGTGRQIILELDLEALLSQLLPHRRNWTKKEDLEKAKGSRVSASIGMTDDVNHDKQTGDYGLELSAALHHTTRSGKHRNLELSVGWSLQQLLDMLLSMQEDKDGGLMLSAGELVPQRIHGSFATDRFMVEFGNDGHATNYNCHVEDVPGLGALLGTILDAESVHGATLHLELPSAGEMKERLKQAARTGLAFIPIVGCSLGVPTADPKVTKYYEIKFSVTPSAFKKLLYLIPAAGEILAACDKLLDVISDPIGTAEAVVNTPEAVLDMIESFPEVYGNAKRMGIKRIAIGLVMGNHPTVRQFVLASRVKRKMQAAGWKPGDPKPKEWDEIPNTYLEWLSKQPADALVAGAELGKLMEENHIPLEPDYKPISGTFDAASIRMQMDQIEHGFVELDEAREVEKHAGNDVMRQIAANRAQQKAEKLREHLHEVLESGVKESKTARDPESGTSREATVDDAAVNKIDQTKASEKQLEEARSLFGADGDKEAHVIAGPEAEAWIQTFAPLTNEQLGELLVSGRTIIQTGVGKREVTVHGDAQKGFVRALLVKRMQNGGLAVAKGGDAPTDDARLVASERAQAARAEAREQSAGARGDSGKGGGDRTNDGLGTFDEDGEASDVEASGDGTGQVAGGEGADAETLTDGQSDTGERGAAQSDGKSSEKTKTETSGGDTGKADEGRDWTLSEALHISAEAIHKFVVIAGGTVKLSSIGEALRGRKVQFNGKSITLEVIEILNVRRSGRGASAATAFMLRIDAGIAGQVVQEYIVKGAQFTEVHGIGLDKAKQLLAGFQAALVYDGRTWSVGPNATFTVEPFTLKVEGVAKFDQEEIVVQVEFVEVRTSTGYARVTTTDGPQLVHSLAHCKLRVPNPKHRTDPAG